MAVEEIEILDMLARGRVNGFSAKVIDFYNNKSPKDFWGHPTKHRNFRVIEGGKK